jgi:mono/diheme cytochrome c family protein
MIPAPKPLPQQAREHPEPQERSRPVPRALLALTALLTAFGIGYIAQAELDGGSSLGDQRTQAELRGRSEEGADVVDGAALYAARCAACHQAGGTGVPGVFPPLAGSEWVSGGERRLVAIVLHGVTGPITVQGVRYDGAMPAFKNQLGDAELAAVLSHLRTRWGQGAGVVAAASVGEVRAQTASRQTPFGGDQELAGFQ